MINHLFKTAQKFIQIQKKSSSGIEMKAVEKEKIYFNWIYFSFFLFSVSEYFSDFTIPFHTMRQVSCRHSMWMIKINEKLLVKPETLSKFIWHINFLINFCRTTGSYLFKSSEAALKLGTSRRCQVSRLQWSKQMTERMFQPPVDRVSLIPDSLRLFG